MDAAEPALLAPGAEEVDISLMVACYDEEENIRPTLDALTAALAQVDLSYEILIIDDASTDRTVEVARDYQRQHPEEPIAILTNEVNRGLAQNFIEGAFRSRGRYYRLICGDNAEPSETFLTVLQHVGAADLVLFYPSEIRGRSLYRKAISRAYTGLMNLISGNQLNYYNGLPIFRRYHVLRWHTNYRGFGFQADLVTRLLDEGVSHMEVCVVHQDRESGESKALTLSNGLSVAHTALDIAIRRVGRALRQGS